MVKEETTHTDGQTKIRGLGWRPDFPNFRDYHPHSSALPDRVMASGQKETIPTMYKRMGLGDSKSPKLPLSVDLRQWCPPVEDQLNLGSCTANAAVGLVEYFERRAFNKHLDASRLFVYKATRNLMKETGDTGAFLRSTMGALALFGAPPEEYWPYNINEFDTEPPAFCYAFGQNFQSLLYYRLDPLGTNTDVLLKRIKLSLAAGLPSMFGFTVYSSIRQASSTGKIPFPAPSERLEGGHAIVAVGFDDKMKIKNTNQGGKETVGALLIRNSWGSDWGPMGGYAWFPYEYVTVGLAEDWWTVLKNEWVDTGQFKI